MQSFGGNQDLMPTAEDYKNLGNKCALEGKFDDAILEYEKALSINPNYAEAYNNLANVLKHKGDIDAAIILYERSIALKPDDPSFYNNLGTALKERSQSNEAIIQYQKAIALKPDYAEVYSNLGNIYKNIGRLEDAIKNYSQAIILKPEAPDIRLYIALALIEANKNEGAIIHLRECLKLSPDDRYGAKIILAKLGAETMPERASSAYIEKLYAKRADSWDSVNYKGHELAAKAFESLWKSPKKPDVLDIGCGTGLVGELIHNKVNKLDGLDLSYPMLEKAKAKNIYHNLYQDDLLDFLHTQEETYDVITCAATLIHFGDLRPTFSAISKVLRKEGIFIATLFPNNNEDTAGGAALSDSMNFAYGGLYTHGRKYIAMLAKENDLNVEMLNTEIHEYYENNPIMGLVIGLKK